MSPRIALFALVGLKIIGFDDHALAQPIRPENKAVVSFSTKVLRASGNEFFYQYAASNSLSSEEPMTTFRIPVRDGELLGRQARIIGPSNKKWYFSGSNQGFVVATHANRYLNWYSENALHPGDSMNFSFCSKGLPSINLFYAESFAPPFTDSDVDSLQKAGVTSERIFPEWKENSFKGFTISPGIPDSPFVAFSFLDTLLSYARQSAELGWLGRGRDDDCDNDEKPEEGIVRNIEQRLGKAKKLLERRDSVLARRELEKLVDKVERLWKRSQDVDKKDKRNRWEKKDKVVMTSETYALLKYNLEYMIDRLPDRKPKKGSKDKD